MDGWSNVGDGVHSGAAALVIVVPTLWWHATCNMAPEEMTFAIGSQGPEPRERADRVHQADQALARLRNPSALARMIEKEMADCGLSSF